MLFIFGFTDSLSHTGVFLFGLCSHTTANESLLIECSGVSKAHLFNYPGIGSVDGSVFLDTLRDQVDDFGVERHDGKVTGVESTDEGFAVSTDDETHEATYVVLATGANRDLAESLGCAFGDDDTVEVGVDMETSVENAYATGAMVRAEEWQAVIAAGDGGAAALNILSKEKGEHFHDFDVPADAERVLGSLVDDE